jgi:predicted lipid-binding transport protein (Tim44 family)
MKITRLIAVLTVLTMVATPVLSYAKAGGGRSGGGSSQGSRGSRTFDNNGYKPIERSTTPQTAVSPAPVPAVPPQPVGQPSFFQRHPILTGLAAGFAGSWLGHMLFGANNSLAAGAEGADAGAGSMWPLILLLAFGALAVYYFTKMRRPSVATTGPAFERSALASETAPSAGGPMAGTLQLGTVVSSEDESKFRQMLVDVQAAWSKQDLDALKRLTTPEMLHYFSDALSENVSAEVENHVEDVGVQQADVREAWTEDSKDYATMLLRWKARDYTVSLAKRKGEPGYLIDGDDQKPTEAAEAWTFMRYRGGKWLLSAIQQVE